MTKLNYTISYIICIQSIRKLLDFFKYILQLFKPIQITLISKKFESIQSKNWNTQRCILDQFCIIHGRLNFPIGSDVIVW